MKTSTKILLCISILILVASVAYIGYVMGEAFSLGANNTFAVVGGMDIFVAFEIAFMVYPFPTLPLIIGGVLLIISIIKLIKEKKSGKKQ